MLDNRALLELQKYPNLEAEMYSKLGEIPINRIGVIFLIEKEMMFGIKQFKHFDSLAQFEIIWELVGQSEESQLKVLSNLIGVHFNEIKKIINNISPFQEKRSDFECTVLEETLLFFSEEILDLCAFVRNRIEKGEEFICVDKHPLFAVSFDPYPSIDVFGQII